MGEGRHSRRLETRLLVVDEAGLGYGATYKWRPDPRDADLLTDGLREDFTTATASGPERRSWYYPSRGDCLVCHNAGAGFVLGVNTRQLNGPSVGVGGVPENQLRTWNRLGLFERPIPGEGPDRLPRLAALADRAATLEQRVRSYLDANCSQCHRPGASPGLFDVRFDTPLARQNLLQGPLVSADLGARAPLVVVPGDPARSMLHLRMARRRDVFNMPPLATEVVDEEAVRLVAEWIKHLPDKQTPQKHQSKD